MDYQVVTDTVSAQPLAAVKRCALSREAGSIWKSALDLVWEFLHRHEGLRTDGHNCFLYHHSVHRDAAMDIYFGVQVVRPFESQGEVICTETPAGEVAMTTHVGGYEKLAAAHDAIHSWRTATGRTLGGCSWEIYGDWTYDTTKLKTQVVYLLS
jgi:effector-binding domain-containing protein